MSYILDALKKVERERAGGRHPLLEVAAAPRPERRRRWPWAVAGALVLNAAVAGVVALRWSPGPAIVAEWPAAPEPTATMTTTRPPVTPSSPAIAAARETAPGPARSRPAAEPTPAVPAPTPAAAPQRRIDADTASGVSRATPRPAPATTASPPVLASPPASREPHARATPPASPPAPRPGPAPSGPDLPPAFLAAIEKLKLEVLLYGDTAADRMVFINGRKYVEGQHVGGEVVVERITADGVVLSREGRHYLLTPSR